MKDRPSIFLQWTLLIACFFCVIGSGCKEGAADSDPTTAPRPITNADEREIVSTVLKHLSERKDSPLGPPDGVILIRSKSDAWPKESFSHDSADPKSKCPITRSQYISFEERNPIQRDARELVDETDAWKFASESEEKELLLIGRRHSSGREIRTLLSISAPAGDTTGALVIFRFTWSIHGGLARYLVQWKDDHWEVKCSTLDIHI